MFTLNDKLNFKCKQGSRNSSHLHGSQNNQIIHRTTLGNWKAPTSMRHFDSTRFTFEPSKPMLFKCESYSVILISGWNCFQERSFKYLNKPLHKFASVENDHDMLVILKLATYQGFVYTITDSLSSWHEKYYGLVSAETAENWNKWWRFILKIDAVQCRSVHVCRPKSYPL